jgi:hypothetical protein
MVAPKLAADSWGMLGVDSKEGFPLFRSEDNIRSTGKCVAFVGSGLRPTLGLVANRYLRTQQDSRPLSHSRFFEFSAYVRMVEIAVAIRFF